MQALKSIDWNSVIDRLVDTATSELAREELRETSALNSQTEASNSFSEILQAQQLIQGGQRPFMESLDLFLPWHQRLIKNATLKPLELKDVRHFCIETIALSEILQGQESPWSNEVSHHLMRASEPLSAIDQIMTTSGEIRPDASELLFKLTQEKKSLGRNIQNTLDKIVKNQSLETVLQEKYVTNREGRWVIPVKSGMQHDFDGIIHAASQSKQTVFMEPKEIIPVNNRLRQIESDIESEIERLLVELSQYLNSLQADFEQTKDYLLKADVKFAQAQLTNQLNAQPCEFSDDEVVLENVRHPVLVLNNEGVIPNSVTLNKERRILLLSGPNAGGKTVLLKSVGLAIQMARCGLPICADSDSKLPFFKKLHVAVGDSQSVDENLSTFAAHLKTLNEATSAKGPQDLLLIDEICGSTDPEEGAALARSFITSYASAGTFGVITSHLGALKKGWEDGSGVINGSLEFDNETGPTYRFFMGVPGQSLAIQTARRVGVNEGIVDQALKFLSPEMKKYQEGLKQVDSIKDEIQKIREELVNEREKTRKAKEKYEKLQSKFERERREMVDITVKRAERKVEKMIQHAKVDDTFKKHSELEKVKAELPNIVKSSPQNQKSSPTVTSSKEFQKAFPPGSKVYAVNIGRDGVVQGEPNSKGEVPVLSNSMRLMIHWEQLKPPQQAANPTQEVLRRSSHYSVSHKDSDRIVDLRGLNVEEAISQLEIQLDTAALNQEDRIKVVHGHGTNTLKRSVRSYLSRSIYVKKWLAGTPDTGGDGVTWIEIKD